MSEQPLLPKMPGLIPKGREPVVYSRCSELRTMLCMGWPILVSFLCRLAMGATDAAFCGHVTTGGHSPEVYLAAATLSEMVTIILTSPPLAFSSGLNTLVGQAMGAGNPKMAGVWLQLSVVYMALAHIPALFSMFFVEEILLLLGFSETVSSLAGTYAKWNVFWPIPNGWYQCMRFYFQAQEITRPAMWNNIFFFFVNVFLNWLFVFRLGYGFLGAALSISASRCLQPFTYWLYMFRYRKAHLGAWQPWSWESFTATRRKAMYEQAVPQMGTLLFQSTTEQVTTLLIAQLGTLAVAASSAAYSFTMIWNVSLNATLSAICGVRVGFHLGAGNAEAARKSALLVAELSLVATVICGGACVYWGRQALMAMTSDANVQALATQLLPPVCVGAFAMLVIECFSGGCFPAQGRIKLAMYVSFGFEIPVVVGSVGLALYFFKDLVCVLWAQTAALFLEMAVVFACFCWTDWHKCVQYARERQEKRTPAALASIISPRLISPGGHHRRHFTARTMYAAVDFSPQAHLAYGYPVAPSR